MGVWSWYGCTPNELSQPTTPTERRVLIYAPLWRIELSRTVLGKVKPLKINVMKTRTTVPKTTVPYSSVQ